jgi:hypothetical protein
VHELRHENARYRQRAQASEEKASGYDAAMAELRTMKIAQTINDAAIEAGANPRLTRAALLMDGKLDKLDPAAADFQASADALVKAVIEAEPSLKTRAAVQRVAKAGSDITHPGTMSPLYNDQVTRQQLANAREAGDHDQVARWKAEGKLDAMMRGLI